MAIEMAMARSECDFVDESTMEVAQILVELSDLIMVREPQRSEALFNKTWVVKRKRSVLSEAIMPPKAPKLVEQVTSHHMACLVPYNSNGSMSPSAEATLSRTSDEQVVKPYILPDLNFPPEEDLEIINCF